MLQVQRSPPESASYHSYDLQTWWLNTTQMHYLTVVQVRSQTQGLTVLKSRCERGCSFWKLQGSSSPLISPASRGHLHPMVSEPFLHLQGPDSDAQPPSYKGIRPTHIIPISGPATISAKSFLPCKVPLSDSRNWHVNTFGRLSFYLPHHPTPTPTPTP